jgi:hypothetical protein
VGKRDPAKDFVSPAALPRPNLLNLTHAT